MIPQTAPARLNLAQKLQLEKLARLHDLVDRLERLANTLADRLERTTKEAWPHDWYSVRKTYHDLAFDSLRKMRLRLFDLERSLTCPWQS